MQGSIVLSVVVAYEIVRRYELAAEQRRVAAQLRAAPRPGGGGREAARWAPTVPHRCHGRAAGPSGRRLPGWARAAIVVAIGDRAPVDHRDAHRPVQLTSSGTAQAAVRLLLPILLAGLGGLWSERAGVINIGLEGMMILGTWGAAWAGYQWGPWAALRRRARVRRAGRPAARRRHGDVRRQPHRLRRRDHLLGAGRHEVPVDADLPADARQQPARSRRASSGFDGVLDPGRSRTGSARSRTSSGWSSPTSPGSSAGWSPGLTPLVVLGFALVPLELLPAVAHPVRAAAALRAARTRWPRSRWA